LPIGSLRALIGGEKKYSPPRERMNAGMERGAEVLKTLMPTVVRAAPFSACPIMGSRPGVLMFLLKMNL
jgi:hypothetical protein